MTLLYRNVKEKDMLYAFPRNQPFLAGKDDMKVAYFKMIWFRFGLVFLPSCSNQLCFAPTHDPCIVWRLSA